MTAKTALHQSFPDGEAIHQRAGARHGRSREEGPRRGKITKIPTKIGWGDGQEGPKSSPGSTMKSPDGPRARSAAGLRQDCLCKGAHG